MGRGKGSTGAGSWGRAAPCGSRTGRVARQGLRADGAGWGPARAVPVDRRAVKRLGESLVSMDHMVWVVSCVRTRCWAGCSGPSASLYIS